MTPFKAFKYVFAATAGYYLASWLFSGVAQLLSAFAIFAAFA